MHEDLLSFVKRRLRQVGPRGWPEVEKVTGRKVNFLRKVAYGDRKNPKLDSIQPVIDYFRERPEPRPQ